jgi:hypothetical protein
MKIVKACQNILLVCMIGELWAISVVDDAMMRFVTATALIVTTYLYTLGFPIRRAPKC